MTMNDKHHKRLLTLLLMGVMVSLATLAAAQNSQGLLISVAFKTNNPQGNSPDVSGPEPAATFANPLFGNANVWNNLHFAFGLNTDPSFDNLVDSKGAPTNVDFSITGTVGAVDFWPFETVFDPLRSAFVFWNSWTTGNGAFGAGESTTIRWKLTGLPPLRVFDLCVYGAFADIDRTFEMTI